MKRLAIVTTLLSFWILTGCKSADPNPELKDPIYLDLEQKEKELSGQVEAEKKSLAEAEAGLSKAVPQTGQIKFAKKHYYDSKAKLKALEQQLLYYKSRKESRKLEARDEYLIAFEAGQDWPNKEDSEIYKMNEESRRKSRNWSVKERIAKERGPASPPAKSGH